MSGEIIFLEDDPSGRITAYVRTLARLPVDPPWVLVGGLAVNVRLGRIDGIVHDFASAGIEVRN